jgi:hypothetical protein
MKKDVELPSKIFVPKHKMSIANMAVKLILIHTINGIHSVLPIYNYGSIRKGEELRYKSGLLSTFLILKLV